MTTRTWMAAVCRWLIVLLALGLGVPGRALAERRVALLVGVSAYASPLVPALDGPVHDVAALRDVLVRRWGFRGEDIVTLIDAQATRARVLAEIDALARRSGAGDEVLIYFSGHGTSALDLATGELVVPHGSGALVTHDYDPRAAGGDGRGLVVGRTDLVPRLTALERGRRVWVVMDMCFSGQAVRQAQAPDAAPDPWPVRGITFHRSAGGGGGVDPLKQRMAMASGGREAPPYPYRSTVSLSAADEGETAKDIKGLMLDLWPTLDGRPHGALTDALLRVLDGRVPGDLNGDGWLDLHEVHRAVSDFMARRPYQQTPQRLPPIDEDTQALAARPVLAVKGAAGVPRLGAPQPLRVLAATLPAALRQRIGALPEVRLVEPASRDGADLVLRAQGDQVAVQDAAGDVLETLPRADAERLIGQVRQLAAAARLRQRAQQLRRGVVPVSLSVDGVGQGFGGNLRVGDRLALVLRPVQPGWLVAVNVGSDGRVTPLYPVDERHDEALPAGQVWRSPAQRVQPPAGKDLQFFVVFDRQPAELKAWIPLARQAQHDDAARGRAQAMLERMLADEAGRFVFGQTEFRTRTE